MRTKKPSDIDDFITGAKADKHVKTDNRKPVNTELRKAVKPDKLKHGNT